MLKKWLLIFIFISLPSFLFGQITITSPVLRQVVQRNLNNEASLAIVGSYSQPIDTLQVRFIPVKTGQGTAIDWTLLKANPLGGLFKGNITVKGGWYAMEVRGLLRGKVVGSVARIEKVGVGEVFVIAGQSNAGGSGLRSANETPASDDRVNCANFLKDYSVNGYKQEFDPQNTSYTTYTTSNFSIIQFSQLSKNVTIGPLGLGPYYWGKVGDALASKLNVPIMFFNTGWGGSSVRAWRESAEKPTVPVLGDFQDPGVPLRYFPVGYPYENLNAVLRYYGINLGVRAVLWMEGETQNLVNLEAIAQGKKPPVTIENYLDNLQRLITKSRQDLGTNKLAWVVARTSYSSQRGCDSILAPPKPSPIIVNAQNQAITTDALRPIYPGPFTDNIQVDFIGERDRCVHFVGKGLDEVADAWIKTLTVDNKDFFQTVEPISPDTIPNVSLECLSSQLVRLSLPEGYQQYKWVNEVTLQEYTTRVVDVPSGTYIAKVTRANGNIIQVPSFSVKANVPPKAPVIKALSDVSFCIGTTVNIQSTTEVDNPIYQWIAPATNVTATGTIAATSEGAYKLRVVDKNACLSPISNEVVLTTKSRPVAPTISFTSSTEFCDEQSVTLVSSNVGASGYLWSTGDTTQSITVKGTGTFSVQTRGSNKCLSPVSKDKISTLVNPLPKSPTISALGNVVFCDGGSVNLRLTPPDANKYTLVWESNGTLSTLATSTIKITGTELVKGFVRDDNGCLSKASNAIQITKKDNPSPISILQKGTYTLAAKSAKIPTEYVWSFEGKTLVDLAPLDSIIRATDAGKYSLIGRNIYTVKELTSPLVCTTDVATYDLKSYDDKGLSVYPNPSNGKFWIESRYDLENTVITIFSIDGKQVYQLKVDALNGQKLLDLSTYPEGTYILRAANSNFKISKLISINR